MTDLDIQYTYLGGHVCLSAHARNASKQLGTYTEDITACGQQKVNKIFIDTIYGGFVCECLKCVYEREKEREIERMLKFSFIINATNFGYHIRILRYTDQNFSWLKKFLLYYPLFLLNFYYRYLNLFPLA